MPKTILVHISEEQLKQIEKVALEIQNLAVDAEGEDISPFMKKIKEKLKITDTILFETDEQIELTKDDIIKENDLKVLTNRKKILTTLKDILSKIAVHEGLDDSNSFVYTEKEKFVGVLFDILKAKIDKLNRETIKNIPDSQQVWKEIERD